LVDAKKFRIQTVENLLLKNLTMASKSAHIQITMAITLTHSLGHHFTDVFAYNVKFKIYQSAYFDGMKISILMGIGNNTNRK